MATLCKNCSHALVFNPETQKLECSYCGSSFSAEEVESESKKYRQDLQAESMDTVYGETDGKYMDCYVYTCAECGGEIIINGSESSTNCIYCGNPNVVFSRIARQKCPDYILPFSISKDKAVSMVRERLKKGIFVPRKIKKIKIDCVRGIYLPYWLVNAEFSGAVVLSGQVNEGKHTRTYYFGRAGDMSLLKPFDEDYLAGFYSNVTDITYSDLRSSALTRAKEYFEDEAIHDCVVENPKIIRSNPSIKLNNDLIYAMLPAWFISFKYKKKHHTILINGDTGKVVCGIPWNKILFYSLLIGLGILITAAAFFVFRYTLPFFLAAGGSSRSSSNRGKLIAFLIAGIIALFTTGIRKVVKVIKNIKLTQDRDTFNFMKKRQG